MLQHSERKGQGEETVREQEGIQTACRTKHSKAKNSIGRSVVAHADKKPQAWLVWDESEQVSNDGYFLCWIDADLCVRQPFLGQTGALEQIPRTKTALCSCFEQQLDTCRTAREIPELHESSPDYWPEG